MLRSRSTHFAGVLGWPLEHTLSPVIHNAAFRRLGLDWVYLSFPVAPDALSDAIAGLRALGAMGANVTMPHKQHVIPFLDAMTEDAETVGAVNTIENVGGRLVGHNTDIEGFRMLLERDIGLELGGRSVLILGAGGAARAVVQAVSASGAGEVVVAARDVTRAGGFSDTWPAVAIAGWDEAAADASRFDLIVNATPLGMGSEPSPVEGLREGQIVVDLVYSPPVTPLIDAARAAGSAAYGGLGMLVHQAAAAFRIWTGQEAPREVMSAAALHALGGGVLHREQ